MADLASLILAIPSYVEGFVKVARTVRQYQSLEENHKKTVTDVIFCADTLNYFTEFVNATDPAFLHHPSRPLLEETLAHAYDALHTAENILHNWTSRLDLEDGVRNRTFWFKFADSFSGMIMRKKVDIIRTTPKQLSIGNVKIVSNAAYLAFGSMEIKEATARLDKWTTRFAQLLLTSPILQVRKTKLGKKHSSDVAFVACARERSTSDQKVPILAFSQLDSKFDIDPSHDSGIYRIKSGDYAGYIVDVRNLALRRDAVLEAEARDTEHICRLFADSSMDSEYGARASVGILPCAGYAIGDDRKLHYLLFRLPSGTGTPRTLRSALLAGPPMHPLNSRLEFCVKLATSILIVQSLGLVHKNIRPDSIIITEPLRTKTMGDTLGTPYLLSFGQARMSAGPSGTTSYIGAALARTLYIHPRHLSSTKRRKYQMRDDVYSLGICFLEIAIWRSLLVWDDEKNGLVCDFDLLQISDDYYEDVLEARGRSTDQDKSWLRRHSIVEFAKKSVPATMGITFKDVVVACLRFGEEDEDQSYEKTMEKTYETDPHDEKADLQSVMFVQDILTKLRSLVFSI